MNVRIATYNLFEGAATAYNRLVEFVRTNELDVVCLQEVNGWQDNDFARLKDFTDKILFAAHAYGNSNTEFKLATVSKRAIIGKTLHAEAFWHAALEVRLHLGDREISIVNVHLDPWKEESREGEIVRLLASLEPGRPAIITGDFNSLSRQDNYPPELLQQLQSRGISKFGAQQLEYRVIDRMLQAGFVDVAAAKGVFDPTVPSIFNADKDHEVPVRVDYMFVTPDLLPLVSGVERAKTDLTDAISDHYPLVVTFTLPDTTAPTALPAGVPQAAAPSPLGPGVPPAGVPPAGAASQAPAPPPAPPEPPKEPVKPWVPEGYEDYLTKKNDKTGNSDTTPPPLPEPPKPGDDGVVLWSHNDEK